MNELERQQQLVAALLAVRADNEARGLHAYRANADAAAARALAAALPTVQRLIGEDDFAHLARGFWRDQPPQRGDLGEWGEGFADWLAAHTALAEWPYLGDCARLDWALHACERARDAELDRDSIARLGDTDPARLRIEPMPGLALIESAWPVAQIHAAHQGAGDFDAVREAIRAQRAEAVVVARQGWKAVPQAVDAATARWMRALLDGRDLGGALAAAPQDFDFGAWLARALRSSWVQGIRVLPD